MKKLANKVALITGASSGICKATAESFVKEGAMVHELPQPNGGKHQTIINSIKRGTYLSHQNFWLSCACILQFAG